MGLLKLSFSSGCWNLIDAILKPIVRALFGMIDIIDNIFRRLVGLKSSYDVPGEDIPDFVEMLIETDVVKNIAFSLMLFGVCVLVLCVILAIIRNVYKDDSKVTISSIFGQAIKGVLGFILIPALCLVGVKFSNVILQAIDGATQAASTTNSSFVYGIYSACLEEDSNNPFTRYAEAGEESPEQTAMFIYCQYLNNILVQGGFIEDKFAGNYIDQPAEMSAWYAQVMDAYFGNFPKAKKGDKVKVQLNKWVGGHWYLLWMDGHTIYFNQKDDDNKDGFTYSLDGVEIDTEGLQNAYNKIIVIMGLMDYEGNVRSSWSIKKTSSAWNNSNMIDTFNVNDELNYFHALVACFFIFKCVWNLCYGMAKRIVLLIIYYVLSPIALALYPWDNGIAFGKWKGEFIGYTIGAYGAVAGMNLTIQLMPVVTNFSVFPQNPLLNNFAKLIFLIVLMQGIASLVGTLSSWIGAKDLLKEGKETHDAATAPIKKVAGTAMSIAGMAVGGGAAMAFKLAKSKQAGKSLDNLAGMSKEDKEKEAAEHGFDDVADYEKDLKKQRDDNSLLGQSKASGQRMVTSGINRLMSTKFGQGVGKNFDVGEFMMDRTHMLINRGSSTREVIQQKYDTNFREQKNLDLLSEGFDESKMAKKLINTLDKLVKQRNATFEIPEVKHILNYLQSKGMSEDAAQTAILTGDTSKFDADMMAEYGKFQTTTGFAIMNNAQKEVETVTMQLNALGGKDAADANFGRDSINNITRNLNTEAVRAMLEKGNIQGAERVIKDAMNATFTKDQMENKDFVANKMKVLLDNMKSLADENQKAVKKIEDNTKKTWTPNPPKSK